MRYYIVDNYGNVWGDFQNYIDAENKLRTYTIEQIEDNELEIIEGE